MRELSKRVKHQWLGMQLLDATHVLQPREQLAIARGAELDALGHRAQRAQRRCVHVVADADDRPLQALATLGTLGAALAVGVVGAPLALARRHVGELEELVDRTRAFGAAHRAIDLIQNDERRPVVREDGLHVRRLGDALLQDLGRALVRRIDLDGPVARVLGDHMRKRRLPHAWRSREEQQRLLRARGALRAEFAARPRRARSGGRRLGTHALRGGRLSPEDVLVPALDPRQHLPIDALVREQLHEPLRRVLVHPQLRGRRRSAPRTVGDNFLQVSIAERKETLRGLCGSPLGG